MLKKLVVILLALFSFTIFAQDENDPYLSFLGSVTKVKRSSPREVNDYINQQITAFKNNLNMKVVDTGKAIVLIPRNKDHAATVIKYSDAKGQKAESWGNDKVYISNTFTNPGNWSMKSGSRQLRKHPDVIQAIKDLGLTEQDIDWSRDRNDVKLDKSKCIRLDCKNGEKYNRVTCQCEASGCSEEKLARVTQSCNEKIAANKQLHLFNIKFFYELDSAKCKCNQKINAEFNPGGGPNGDPGGRLKCAENPVKLVQKQAECTAKNDTKTKKFFEFNVSNCKCESTKKLCKGKYWDNSKNEDNLAIYEAEKKACEDNPANKWVGCECKDSLGKNQCVYKEVRKPVGSLNKNKMVYDDLHEHFANESSEIRRKYGPCGMTDWLENIPQQNRVEHCAEREKIKIKGTDYTGDDPEKFKTKRTFCTKCKMGYEEERSIVAIDGINDDPQNNIMSMEEPAYSYVTKCVKSKLKCQRPRDKKRFERCEKNQQDPKNIEKGISYSWNSETCKCEKEKDRTPKVEKTCMQKISQKKIQRCHDRDGEIDPVTCKCDAPCYDIVSDTDQRETGEYTCEYQPQDLNTNNIQTLLGEANDISSELCPNFTLGKKTLPDLAALNEQCKEQIIGMGQPSEGVSTITSEINVKISQEVECPINITSNNTGFADKIPGLVGGLDLEKDFLFNGKKISDPANVDCTKGKLNYNPTLKAGEGNYKTGKLSQKQCDDVVEMHKNIKDQADNFVNSIMSIDNISEEKKLELLEQNFSANVTATANRIPHGANSADHEELSNRRAQSMIDFYVKQVVNNEQIHSGKKAQLLEKLSKKSQAENIAYFGPQYTPDYVTIDIMKKVAGPAAEVCNRSIEHLSSSEMKQSKGSANEDVSEAMRRYHLCTLDYHVNIELPKLASFNSRVDENFAKSLRENSVFKKYLNENNISEDYDVFGDSTAYRNFLMGLYDMKKEDQRAFLDSMKIFDIDASSNFSVKTKKTIESDQKVTCNLNVDELYKSNPIMEDVTVSYGKRPGFTERFGKKCRDDFDSMISEEMLRLKNSGEYDGLKEELKERFPDNWQRKFNNKLRKMAKQNWRDAKYNTRQITKADGGHRRWNQFDGNHSEDDGRSNHTQSFNKAKEQITPIDTWDPTQYLHREQKY